MMFLICPSLAIEAKQSANVLRDPNMLPSSAIGKLYNQLMINFTHLGAKSSHIYAQHCMANAPSTSACSTAEMLADPTTCTLFEMSVPAFGTYVRRAQDTQNILRAYHLARFAQSPAAQSCANDLACAPDNLRDAAITVNSAERKIVVKRLFERQDEDKSLELAY